MCKIFQLLFCICLLVSISVFAVETSEVNNSSSYAGKPLYSQFQWENDSNLPFSRINETDRWYTQGIKFSVTYAKPDTTDDFNFANKVGKWWCNKNISEVIQGCKDSLVHGYTVGQNMYTPGNIKIATPQPNDRPWAGWLYVNRFVVFSKPESLEKPEVKDRFDLTVGVTGKLSYAEQIQKWWHRDVASAPAPMGWDNQLKNELGVNVAYERRTRNSHRFIDKCNIDGDFTYSFGGHAGTVLTALKAGGEIRIGKDLLHYQRVGGDLPPIEIFAPPPKPAGFEPLSTQKQEMEKSLPTEIEPYYFQFGTEVRAVARNLFLDGNHFSNSPSVHKKTWVYDVWAGFSFNVKKQWKVTYKQVRRSPDFDTSTTQAAFQKFSVLTVSYQYK